MASVEIGTGLHHRQMNMSKRPFDHPEIHKRLMYMHSSSAGCRSLQVQGLMPMAESPLSVDGSKLRIRVLVPLLTLYTEEATKMLNL
jgi:hypothetical protein